MARSSGVVWGQNPFALDPAKPAWRQVAVFFVQLSYILGGPVLGLVTIQHYPPLVMDASIYLVGLGSIALWFVASFPLIGDTAFPRGMPVGAKLMFRAGWAICTTFLLFGLGGIANGYGMPLTVRHVAAVAKHPTLERDPARRVYYVAIRAWPGEIRTVNLGVGRAVYEQLDLPLEAIDTPQAVESAMPDAAKVRLVVGEGRLGLPWLHQVELEDGS